MVFDEVNHLSSSHLNILLFSRLCDQNCIIRFQRGNSYIIVVLELIWLRRMVCFTYVWSRCDGCNATPMSSPFNFRGRARPMWISGTATSRLTDTDDLWLRSVCFGSGAQGKSTHGIVVFAKHFRLLEPADGTCRRRAYTTLCVTHRLKWFHLMWKLSAQGV